MNKAEMSVIENTDSQAWESILKEIGDYDFYHLPSYHRLGAIDESGKAMMFVYRESDNVIAMPFIVRPIESVPGLESAGKGLKDATSVYGYPGPIAKITGEDNTDFLYRYANRLEESFRELELVSVFTRLNPVLDNQKLLPECFGELVGLGETISIDLTLDPDQQLSQIKKDTRYDIRKAKREGVEVHIDEEWEYFDDFIKLYEQTMERVSATDYYFFDEEYFRDLKENLADRAKLFVARYEGTVCSASIFIKSGGIIQHHLAGNHADFSKLDAPKVVIDEARQWGNRAGASTLHLGGGLSSSEDAVFWQKSRFSPVRHRFFVWKWDSKTSQAENLVNARRKWLESNGDAKALESGYFPTYRAV